MRIVSFAPHNTDGFLGNLDQVRKASDSEGAAWRSFVTAWWDRFGTAEVTTADLFDVAIVTELDLGPGLDRAQRTRLGKGLGRLRDRIFAVSPGDVQVVSAGKTHQAARWKLRWVGEHQRVEGNIAVGCSPPQDIDFEGSGERGEHGERFPDPHTRARAHARDRKAGNRFPTFPMFPKHNEFRGLCRGTSRGTSKPIFPTPFWHSEMAAGGGFVIRPAVRGPPSR